MLTLHRSRPLTWIALVAWWAQLCLPAAHAAAMAEQAGRNAVWCGVESPALKAQLGRLDAEVRKILQQDDAESGQHADCAVFCASATGTHPVAEPASVRLRAAGIEAAAAVAVAAPRSAVLQTPPARGPPSTS